MRAQLSDIGRRVHFRVIVREGWRKGSRKIHNVDDHGNVYVSFYGWTKCFKVMSSEIISIEDW